MKKIFSTVLLSLMFAAISLPAYAADEEMPSDVENFAGTPLNGAANLTWDSSTDDTGVAGYQLHYGDNAITMTGETYDTSVDVGNVTEYMVTELENGTTYYFSVIAYDDATNESAHWAKEISLTPEESYGDYEDTDAPKVSDAESLNKEAVEVVFSEEVVLPDEDPHFAFTVENDDTFVELEILSVEMDEEDKTNKTVILTTAEQVLDATYKLTVGIDIEDKAGNPIISGTSDTAIFNGSDREKEGEDLEGPELVDVDVLDNTHVFVEFNEAIVLSIDPSENFTITQEDDETVELEVLGVELKENSEGVEDAAAELTTSPQEEVSYVLVVSDVEDEAGNEVSLENNSWEFTGSVEDDSDNQSVAQDVKELVAKYVLDAEKYVVTLTWDVIEENLGLVTEQVLYLSDDKKATYDAESSLDADSGTYEMENMDPGEYYFKLTQRDTQGNETEGTLVRVVLSETGPGILGLLVVSLGLGRLYSKKRKQ